MAGLCKVVQISRQAYYKERKVRQRRQVNEEAILELVKRERAVQPRLGTRKLMACLGEEWREMGINLGRDGLFSLLRRQQMLVERPRRGVRTTASRHGFRTYENVLRDMIITAPHQAWVSDLTYVRTEEGFMYVSLISDVWSRKIVGYSVSPTLEAQGSLEALGMALKQLPEGSRPVHHSDRGIQYCCGEYVKRLEQAGLRISMTQENHCYENAQAERLNGILKQEYGLGGTFAKKEHVREAVAQAVMLYNTRRPHVNLNYQTPERVHSAA